MEHISALLPASRLSVPVSYIGDNCSLLETDTSDHVIHTVHSDFYIQAVNTLQK